MKNEVKRSENHHDQLLIDEHFIASGEGTLLVRDYRVSSPRASTAFLWVHGGGFTNGGLDQKESDVPARKLAEIGIWVRTVDYRLAPKYSFFRGSGRTTNSDRFPAALDDVVVAAKALARQSGRAVNIGGASAGANLAAAATLRLRDEKRQMPRSVALAYGTFHAVLPSNDLIESELRGLHVKRAFNAKMLRRMNLNYVGDSAALRPGYAFPGGADLHDFPPTLVLDARDDRLRRSGHAFANELRAAGSEVQEIVVQARHGFLNSQGGSPFSKGVVELAGWLAAHDRDSK